MCASASEPHKIALTRGLYAIVDEADFAELNRIAWHLVPRGGGGYAAHWVREAGGRKLEYMHRLLLPGVDIIDHRNGNGLDNRRSNLRPATHGENMRNRRTHRNNTSGFIGVSWDQQRGKWRARVRINGREIKLGRFTDPIDAARARDAAAVELHGDFAVLNFPGFRHT